MYELYCSAITSFFSTKDLQRRTVSHTKYDHNLWTRHCNKQGGIQIFLEMEHPLRKPVFFTVMVKHDHKTLQNASTSFNIKSQHDVSWSKTTFFKLSQHSKTNKTTKQKETSSQEWTSMFNSSFILAQTSSALFLSVLKAQCLAKEKQICQSVNTAW